VNGRAKLSNHQPEEIMKSYSETLGKVVLAVILGVIVSLSTSVMTLAQSPAQSVTPVLEGLDPILLVQGKEVQGDIKIAVTRGKFQYLFASAENKAIFEKDPTRYEIQMDGACARMGPPVTGNPDLFTVFDGRIYIFGSGECKKRFEAAPKNYLEAESGGTKPEAVVTPEALKKGQSLIERAVAAVGGAARIDGLTSYQEKNTVVQTRRQGEVEVKTTLTVLYPDRIRSDQSMPDWNNPSAMRQMSIVILPSQVFGIMAGDGRSLPDSVRNDQEKELKRRPLSILRARKTVTPAAIGDGNVGDTAVEQVAIEIDGVRHVLGIDPATGRILSLSSRRRGPDGSFGQFVQVFTDFRTVGGLTLPFKVNATFNDQPWKEKSPTIGEITVNAKFDPALFEQPKTGKTQ
jgi:YHS domain-containing protein